MIAWVAMTGLSAHSADTDAPTLDAPTLINEILEKPGQWNQMCSIFRPSNEPPSIPLFGYYRDYATYWISEANFVRLRAQRTPVLKEISTRLDSLASDTAKAVEDATRKLTESKTVTSSNRLRILSAESDELETYLMILLDLNGIEALPALLRLESALDKVAVYRLPNDDREWIRHGEFADGLKVSIRAPKQHNRVLSIISALLLYENAEGLTESALFDRYTEVYRQFRDEFGEKFDEWGLKPLPVGPSRDRGVIDEILRHGSYLASGKDPFSVELTQKNRDLIIELADAFSKNKRPDEFRAAEAIVPAPRYR